MTLVDITGLTANQHELTTSGDGILNADGKRYNFTLPPGAALIDRDGVVRFFSLVWDDGEVYSYLLHPLRNGKNRSLDAIDWVAEFLSSYGISKVSGQLVRRMPYGQTYPVQIAASIASTLAGQVLKSFERKLIKKGVQLAYHNVLTEQPIWYTLLEV